MPANEKPDAFRGNRRWQFGWCEYAEGTDFLLVHGKPVRMEGKPLRVLEMLLRQSDQTVPKQELLDTIWDYNTGEGVLPQAILKLRGAIGGPRDGMIASVAGKGYRMAVPVFVKENAGQSAPVIALQPGDQILGHPEWIVVRGLGRASSGVWLARGRKTPEQRVFKFAVANNRLQALRREVEIFRLLQRSFGNALFLVRILSWQLNDPPYFTESEYGGIDLAEWALTPGFRDTPVEERVRLVAQIADAVEAAHSIGILHNDLKPENILVDAEAQGAWRIRILDFGVASFADPEHLRELALTHHDAFEQELAEGQRQPLGTPAYWAPELQSGGVPTVKCDVYAIGVLLFQMVCGDLQQMPSPGWQARIADPLLRDDIAAAANHDPANRIATARDIGQRLHTLRQRREDVTRREADAVAAARKERELERARLRRPFIALAAISLALTLLLSVVYSIHAVRQRDQLRVQNERLAAMNSFIREDMVAQVDPYSSNLSSQASSQQTFLDALRTALPKIDRRFQHAPEIAGSLHETMADAFRNRTRFEEADAEYQAAAREFKQADGPGSPRELIAKLKRDSAQLTGSQAAAVEAVGKRYKDEAEQIGKIRKPSAELLAWQAFVHTALVGYGPHPEQTLPIIAEAIQQAEAVSGFDQTLLIGMKLRYCGTYMRLGDGINTERAARKVIRAMTDYYGEDSPRLFQAEIYLQEAFYLQGRFRDAVAQADHNYAQFTRVLSADHQLTQAVLANRAADKGQLEDYDGAVADDLLLHAAAERGHGDPRLLEGSLADAATFQCHGGHLREGEATARHVLQALSAPGATQSMVQNGIRLTLAECLAGEAETAAPNQRLRLADEAQTLLQRVDVKFVADQISDPTYPGNADVLRARLALLRGDTAEASRAAAEAVPLLQGTSADPFERRQLAKVQAALSQAH